MPFQELQSLLIKETPFTYWIDAKPPLEVYQDIQQVKLLLFSDTFKELEGTLIAPSQKNNLLQYLLSSVIADPELFLFTGTYNR